MNLKTIIILGYAACSVAIGYADTFKCNNADREATDHWFAQLSNTRQAGVGRKPGFLLLTNAQRNGTILNIHDRHRLLLGGRGESGTSVTVNLKAREIITLNRKASRSLNLEDVAQVTLFVDYEMNEPMTEQERRMGELSFMDTEGELLHSTEMICVYAKVTDEVQ